MENNEQQKLRYYKNTSDLKKEWGKEERDLFEKGN
jgi:hypothetical protein